MRATSSPTCGSRSSRRSRRTSAATSWRPTIAGSVSDDREERLRAARAWSLWEGATSWLVPDPSRASSFGEDDFAEAFARIENHYFVHGGFFRHPDQLLEDVDRIRHIPCVIVQGRYDMCCPMTTAWDLHRRWPEADLQIVPDAGHAAAETGTMDRLVTAADRFRDAS